MVQNSYCLQYRARGVIRFHPRASNLISMNKALKALREKLRDDEKRHHNALKKLSEKPFFQIDPNDFTVIFQGEEFAEDRYRKSKERREKVERAR